jgi:hypothetical protein
VRREVLLRTAVVLVLGGAVLAAILYYASTVDSRPPSVSAFGLTQHLPSDGGVALTTSSLTVDFSEPVASGSAERSFRVEPSIRGSFSWSGNRMIFTPIDPLPLSTTFRVQVASGVRDRAGNEMAAAATFTFQTVGQPRVVATQPADAGTDVPLDAPIELTFSTLMDTASVADALSVTPRIDYRLRWSGQHLSIVPTDALDPGRTYAVRIGVEAQDTGGASLRVPFILRFTTVSGALRPATIVPSDGSQGIAVTSPIALFFDRPLDPASVTDDLIEISPAVAGRLEAIAAPGAAGLSDDSRRILRFQPSGPLPANTTFDVTISDGLRAADGAQLIEPIHWTFLTGAPAPALGNQILFVSDRAGVGNLWAMNPDGTGQRQISAELSPVVSYAVAPDGRSFVVGDGARLVEQDADGGNRRLLTEAGWLEYDPSYAPDGSGIVFGRAELGSGAGAGLWMRGAGGGDARRIELPGEASPTPSGSGEASPAPLVRAPVFSPDGTAIACATGGGEIAIVVLDEARQGATSVTRSSFSATSPPAWLPDSSGVLVSGLPAGQLEGRPAGAVVPPLTPSSAGVEAASLGGLRIVRLDRGAATTVDEGLPFGASQPLLDSSGRIAYLRLGPETGADGGTVWLSRVDAGAGRRISTVDAIVSSVSFTPDPNQLLVARLADRSSGGTAAGGGVWLLAVQTGIEERRSDDGSQPRWIP